MAKQTINLGTPPSGSDGDTYRTANVKTISNFDELYLRAQGRLQKSIAGGAGTVVLTATEALNGIIDFVGDITGNKVIQVPPTTTMMWVVRNSTAGNFSVTFQVTGAATGIVIPRGVSKLLYSNGADMFDATAEPPSIIKDGVLEISGAAPTLMLTETDQTAPVGRWQWRADGGSVWLQRMLTAPGTYDNMIGITPAGLDIRPLSAGPAYSNRLTLSSGASGQYQPFMRSNSNEQCIQFVNSANTRVMMRLYENGQVHIPGRLQVDTSENATKLFVGGFGSGYGYGVETRPVVGGNNAVVNFLTVNGVSVGHIASSDSAVAYNSASDYRVKANYAPMAGALESVRRMKFYTGEFRAEPGKLYDYVLAHELQEELPSAVTGEKDAMGDWYPVFREGYDPDDVQPGDVVDVQQMIVPQAVDYSRLVPRLGAAVQELAGALEQALARLAQLEAST
ncbi:hypothetical protein CURE108131_25160 [Cupriavidus respiraculi]|uniref:Peptidase S74 domain-containing protein n=1 Tax=Cupriavidus respiraculi TaxID=195930 RepID=A0ABM8XV98_9BURK|nr:hypothetical protein [Cupriavidus respiraculi]CAG9184302.1 hypothetical protein LMG21510_05063 [Cupriavidus respiraculi]